MKNEIDIKKIKENALSISKNAAESAKNAATSAKNAVTNVTTKASEKVKETMTEEQVMEVLNTLYTKSIEGIPKISVPVDDLVNDYMSKNDDLEKAVKSLINNSTVKCGTSGFVTSFGGAFTSLMMLPANLTSVMYVQTRMCVAIAKMGGYDIHSDQVQTLIYVCLTGNTAKEILKKSGITFAKKVETRVIEKIPGKTLIAINKKIGFRFLTKFGSKGIINLGKVVPVVGGIVGLGIDAASTKIIGKNAYNLFIKGELPEEEKIEEIEITKEDFDKIDDIDTKVYNENML